MGRLSAAIIRCAAKIDPLMMAGDLCCVARGWGEFCHVGMLPRKPHENLNSGYLEVSEAGGTEKSLSLW
jgi:hypothetical protein